jgi:lipopolysaccharide transport system ATP-binding protein
MSALIIAEDLGKIFGQRNGECGWKSFFDRSPAKREPLWALKNISFEVRAGEMLGVIGSNGAGKSTLLRLLGGIGRPTVGRVEVRGKIGSLLELGGGFQGDLTGRENAILAGVVAGLLKCEVIERMPEIIRFAELENFIDSPVRTYSTGMAMRLAFAVAVHTNPDVMLIDEYLSVGDLAFQAKCSNRIAELRDNGCAMVLVSHGMDQVKKLCDRALWLRRGEMINCGPAKAVTDAFEEEMRLESLRRTPDVPVLNTLQGIELRPRENRVGSLEMTLTLVSLRPSPTFMTGGPLEVTISYHSPKRIKAPVFVVAISRSDGTLCLDTNTQSAQVAVPDAEGPGTIRLAFDRLDLVPGTYFLDVGVFESSWNHAYDYHWHAYQLTVEGSGIHKGIVAPPCRWAVSKNHDARDPLLPN